MFNNQIIAGSSGQGGGSFYSYSIDQSLRFEESGTANLTFTPSNNGTDNKKFTYSVWIKRGQSSADDQRLIQSKNTGGGTGQGQVGFTLDTSDSLDAFTQNGGANPTGTRLLRDHSGWYHCCFVYDTTEATASDRVKVYINGDRDTLSGSFPPLNSVMSSMNYNGQEQYIGKYVAGFTRYFNGYMAEIHMVDGQALSPTDFAEEVNGIWVPKEYTDNGTISHGVNGYHLTFQGTGTATTSQGTTAQINIGDDQSGNGNNWTVNNLAASDVVLDSPTNNFATWNQLDKYNYNAPSEGNLRALTAGNNGTQNSTFAVSSGKWYFEVRNGTAGSGSLARLVGIAKEDTNIQTIPYTNADCYLYYSGTGDKYNGSSASYGDSWDADGDIIGVALDMDNGAIWFSKNGTWQNSATASEIAAGTTTNAAFTGLSGTFVMMVSKTGGTSSNDPHHANFGQDSTFAGDETAGGNADDSGLGDFAYTVPSGFNCLASANLPEPAIGPNSDTTSDQNFNTVLYTGTGATQSITGVGFQPDWVFVKRRAGVQEPSVTDSVRGVNAQLRPAATAAESAQTDALTSFDADGFTLGADATNRSYNFYTDAHVAWNWKAGGTAVSNTDGDITSSVSANPDAGFSIVSWSATNTDNQTIGHGLSATPELIISKSRNTAGTDWWVWAASESGNYGRLNSGGAFVSDTSIWYTAGMSSTTFGVRLLGNNYLSRTYIAYCFHSVPGYSAVGSYIGNANADGTFVYLGFRPRWLMLKDVSNTNIEWNIYYDEASPFNVMNDYIAVASAAAEATNISTRNLDFVSNGFKLRDAFAQNYSADYVYIAFAQAPFKYANAR